MENKCNKRGNLSRRKMKLINYEDKISKMSKQELAKELQEIANEGYGCQIALYAVWTTVDAIMASTSYDNDEKANSILFGSFFIWFFINLVYYINKDVFSGKKLKILSKYVDSEEEKEIENEDKKTYLDNKVRRK